MLEKFSVALPKQATYFITFIMVKTFADIPMEILNIGEVVVRRVVPSVRVHLFFIRSDSFRASLPGL